ncbi:MAG TPA: adenylate/guanylate cyclase domain-containing protein [Phototrophicaceae bacterium]|jgi:PAS domain S-box-containing protein|nr:adenylate/guanylate cyclase domain-containing protein [Phototrophicaceae bacterium]
MADGNTTPQQTTVLSEIRNLKNLLEEISVSLKNQREILKVRGITLPPMTMQSLQMVGSELDKLERRVVGEQTELGQLRSLADNVAMINSTFDLDAVLINALDVVITLTGAERGYIIFRKPETGELDFRVARENELSPSQRSAPGTIPQISQTIVHEVLASGDPLLTDNAYKDERLQNMNSIAAFSLRSVLCVPLKYKGEIMGAVYVDNRIRAGVFEQRESNLLGAFANLVSIAIENARLFTNIEGSVAELTEIKELINNIFESIGSGIITSNAEDLIMTFNRAATVILMREREHVMGQRLDSVLPDVSVNFDDYLQKVLETGERQVIDAEFKVGADDHRIAVTMKLSPLRDADHRTQGVTMVLDDITNQRDRDEMLNIMKRYLPPQLVTDIHSIAGIDLGGERREVTCMYVDTRPLYTMPAGLRPQQIMEVINVYLAAATDCIHSTNGLVDKFMGQEIMALFNTQLNPLEDHAARAVQAAMLIREKFLEIYRELGIDPNPHYYRIGMNTGIATLGNCGSISRRDFTAIGDTINLSKRLEENAKLGQILISETTREHLEQHPGEKSLAVRFDELEPLQVKGRQQKTRVYEIFRL